KATFPEEYHQPDFAGKEAVFKVKLHEIKVKELPVLDDEFAKSLGNFETMAALKEDLRKRFLENKEKKAQRDFENAVIEKVVANSSVEVTETLINREVDRL
ncbi:MAG TPA: trigger factor, partial [Firmicutes bacterium]|nr:trigger factor [Bacillota bacterium]